MLETAKPAFYPGQSSQSLMMMQDSSPELD